MIKTITKSIKKIEIIKDSKEFELINRQETLFGKTYKLKTPILKRSLYITINNIKVNERLLPFELFINTKNLEAYSWMQAFSVLISALFRQFCTFPHLLKLDFLIYQLKTICDPEESYFSRGKRMPSVVSELGHIIENHLIELGLFQSKVNDNPLSKNNNAICPNCFNQSLIKSEGCENCLECCYSKCS